MSYQEYANLGKSTRRNRESNHRETAPRQSRQRSDFINRPLNAPVTSFSVPRRTLHSSQSSQSSVTLTPSNSASQKGNRSPISDGSDGLPAVPLQHLKGLDLAGEKKPNLVDVPLPWRPFYLQRRILATFILTFAGLIVTIEALWSYSNRNGLGTVTPAARYLWAYGPVAIFTVVAAVWNRVDYQAKSAAPWIRLSKAPSEAGRTLLLDYLSMSQPKALVRGLQNGDIVVACTSAIAISLKLMIIVSTALVTLMVVDLGEQSIPIILQTEFAGNASSLMNASSTTFFAMVGLQQDNLSYPDGVSGGFAYQQFSANLPGNTDVSATVDGLAADLDCSVAQLSLAGVQFYQAGQQFNTSFAAGGCNVTMPVLSKGFVNDTDSFFARFGQGSCGGSNKTDDQRIVVVIGKQNIDSGSLPTNATANNVSIQGTISQSEQLLCKPTYNITQVDVQKQGSMVSSINFSKSSSTRTLSAVQPWDIAQAVFASYKNDLASTYGDTASSFYTTEAVNVDPAMYLALGMQFAENQTATDPSSLLDSPTLQTLASDYYQQYSALLTSNALTQAASTASTGTAVVSDENLMMGTLGAQLLAVLLATSIGFAGLAMAFVPRRGFLPRDPGTIMDTAALIAHSRPLLQSLRGAGGGSMSAVHERLRGASYSTGVEAYEHTSSAGSGYFKIFGGQGTAEVTPDYTEPGKEFPYPDLLHPIQRVFVFVLVVGIIVALELSLQISTRNNGLGEVGDVSYLHIIWTSGPALVLTLLAMYFASTDLTIRTLAPFAALQREAAFSESISLNHADKASPSVLLHALKTRNLAVGGSVIALSLSSLLAIAVASVFTATVVPLVTNIQLTSQDAFGPADATQSEGQNGTIVASLILDSNFSYPPFTFEDMNFPTLAAAPKASNLPLTDDTAIIATVPALRPSMACTLFKQSDIRTNFTGANNSLLRITLSGEPSGAMTVSLASNSTGKVDQSALFGAGQYAPIAQVTGVTPHWVYAWGQLSDAGGSKVGVKAISALACNETMQQVGTTMTFLGSSMTIDPNNPPQPIESTAATMGFKLEDIDYRGLMNISSTPNLLDRFFTTLIASYIAVPLSDLGNTDPNVAQGVADAITRQHKIIRTQVINTANRQPIEVFGIGRPVSNAVVGSAAVFTGVSTSPTLDAGATHRVVQDMVSTRILQGLLVATLIASIASWIGLPKPNLLPRSPTSIGSMAAFLADGNIFGLLGRGAEWQSTKELRGFFMDGMHVTMCFKIGWDRLRRRRREETLAVWGMNGSYAKDQVFAISAVRTGGWGGGEGVGLGLQARVGYAHRNHVRDWGWRT